MAEQKAPRKKATPPLTPEEFEVEVQSAQAEFQKLGNFFGAARRKGIELPEGAPPRGEYNAVVTRIGKLNQAFKKMHKMNPKKGKGGARKGKANQGFNIPRLITAAAVSFINTHGQLPPNLQVQPLVSNGNRGIATQAQLTQLVTWYVQQKGLKVTEPKSLTKLDATLRDLLSPHFAEYGVKPNEQGEYLLAHNTIQRLLPNLAEKIQVPESMLTPQLMQTLADRSVKLKERTKQNQLLRKQKAAEAKAEKARLAAQEAAAELNN